MIEIIGIVGMTVICIGFLVFTAWAFVKEPPFGALCLMCFLILVSMCLDYLGAMP